jgi:hypothetical protein
MKNGMVRNEELKIIIVRGRWFESSYPDDNPELEIIDSRAGLDGVRAFLFNIVHYIIEKDVTFKVVIPVVFRTMRK